MEKKDQERFEFIKSQNPGMSDEEIWTKVSIDRHIGEAMVMGPQDGTLTDKIIEFLIQSAQNFLERNLPKIFEKVEGFFRYALENMGEWLQRGWDYLTDLIDSWF